MLLIFSHTKTQLYLAHLPVEWVCDQSGEQGHGTPLFLIWTFVGRSQHRNQCVQRAFTDKNQAGSAISQFILYLLITLMRQFTSLTEIKNRNGKRSKRISILLS